MKMSSAFIWEHEKYATYEVFSIYVIRLWDLSAIVHYQIFQTRWTNIYIYILYRETDLKSRDIFLLAFIIIHYFRMSRLLGQSKSTVNKNFMFTFKH